MVIFNTTGGWCWYQDERAIVDAENGKIIIGSVTSPGTNVEVVHWDVAAGRGDKFTIDTRLPYTDDHDTPAIIKTNDGGYAAMWAGHKNDNLSRYAYFDGSNWSARKDYDWGANAGDGITYANAWYLGDIIYSYCRSTDTSPNYLYSTDHGKT